MCEALPHPPSLALPTTVICHLLPERLSAATSVSVKDTNYPHLCIVLSLHRPFSVMGGFRDHFLLMGIFVCVCERAIGPFMAQLYMNQGPKMLDTLSSTTNLGQQLQVCCLTPLKSRDEEKAMLRIATEKVEI